MTNRKIEVDIVGDSTKLEHAFKKASDSSNLLETVLKKLGPVGAVVQSGLDKIGLGSLATATGIGAAGGAILAFTEMATAKYVTLAESIHEYMIVTGESANVAGAQVQSFNELGVSEGDAAAAMVKLSKAAETTPGKLEALGIVIAKTSAGNIDLNGTLFNVVDAWNATTDAAKRNLIMLEAFGKGGAAMLPILESGTAEIKKLEAAVRVTFTDADIEQAHKYVLEQKQVKASWEAVVDSLGQKALPAQKAIFDSYLANEYASKKLEAAHVSMIDKSGNVNQKAIELAAGFRKEWQASQDAKAKLDLHTEAMKRAMQAAEDLAKAIDDATNAEIATADASSRAERANIVLFESTDKLEKAQDLYNTAVKQFGPASEQAITASHDLRLANLDQQQAARDSAGAAAALAVFEMGPGATAAQQAATSHDAYIKSLEAERDALGPGSQLRTYLDQYIARLNAIPANVGTNISATFNSADSQSGRGARAGGGPVGPGDWLVGEQGPEMLHLGPGASGNVTSNADLARAAVGSGGGGSGGGPVINVFVSGSVQTERSLLVALTEGMRRLEREKR